MGQILRPDNVPPLVKATSTTCTLAATHEGKPTRVTVGGQQYQLSSTLTLDAATTGLGGLDTGVLSNTHSLYYVYACVNTGGSVGLVASLSAPNVGPSGFSGRYKLVGAFYSMDTGNQIGSLVSIDGPAESEFQRFNGGISNVGAKVFTNNTIWRREGQNIRIRFDYDGNATASGVATSVLTLGNMPTGIVGEPTAFIRTDSIDLFANRVGQASGSGMHTGAGAVNNDVQCTMFDSTRWAFWRSFDGVGFATTKLRISDLNVARTVQITGEVVIPVSGWKTTLLG